MSYPVDHAEHEALQAKLAALQLRLDARVTELLEANSREVLEHRSTRERLERQYARTEVALDAAAAVGAKLDAAEEALAGATLEARSAKANAATLQRIVEELLAAGVAVIRGPKGDLDALMSWDRATGKANAVLAALKSPPL